MPKPIPTTCAAAVHAVDAMQSMPFGVHALDPSAFGSVGLILLAAALLACYLPARRVASIAPCACFVQNDCTLLSRFLWPCWADETLP